MLLEFLRDLNACKYDGIFNQVDRSYKPGSFKLKLKWFFKAG